MMSMGSSHWFKNAIIYHILIDRFYGFSSTENWDKPIFLGGKISGITEKIPYLLDLGVNTIWISPFYQTNMYHGYHITDFYHIDPHFGVIEDLKELVRTVHRNNMCIIADFVANHCSKEHPFFKEAQQNKNSQYRDWFYFTKWPNEYLCFLSVKDLPKINLDNPDAREYMINVAKYWLRKGLDGYRLDHVIGPSHKFWRHFRKEIKKENPNVVLIGEAWMHGIKRNELRTIKVRGKYLKWFFGASSDALLKEYIGELDGVLDFKIQEMIRDYVSNKRPSLTKQSLYAKINHHLQKYPDNYFLSTFLDNHDMNRILFECKNNKEKLKEAAAIQFSINQPPIIYYGTESGMSQDKSIWDFLSYGDLQARQPMNWKKQDMNLFSFYKGIIRERKRMFGNFRTKTNSF